MTTTAFGALLVWLGSDRARKQQQLAAFRTAHHIDLLDRHVLQALGLTPGALLTLAREQPAASPGRLIIVEEAHRLSAACVQALLEWRAAGTGTAWVMLWVEVALEARHPVQALLAQAVVERFEGGTDEGTPGSAFMLVDAIGRRDAAGALRIMHQQLLDGKDPLELLGLVAWQLQRWLTVQELSEAGAGPDRIAASAGLQSWQLDKVRPQLAGRSAAELRRHVQQCWDIDVAAKRGRTLVRPALEQLVIALCLPSASSAGKSGLR